MKRLAYSVILVLSLVLPLQTIAASSDSLSGSETREGAFAETFRPDSRPEDIKGSTESMSEAPFGQLNGMSATELQLQKEKMKMEEQTKGLLKASEGRNKISLQAEPGDTLVSLSWRMSQIGRMPGDQPLDIKYTVLYGPESGKYDKKSSVGDAMEYRLRGLKNHQVYFIKVVGASKDNRFTIQSDEIRAIPLPEEEVTSRLEKSFSQKTVTLQDQKEKIEPDPLKRELKQFGYEFFKNGSATTAHAENIPVGNDYTLGPGDTLRIDMWGTINARYEQTVDRNGEIAIPKVGVIKVWGLSYSQAKEAINQAISRYFKGYQLNVSLGRLRTIQVFAVGEVESPGTYQISSMGTVINALSIAGGPSKNGSLRTIKVMKRGKVVQEVDLYDMFLSGDRSSDIRLENGDTVFVPVIGPVAAAVGEVKRPAIYELKGNTSINQLLAMAGGVTAAGDTARVQLERYEGNYSRVIADYEPKKTSLAETLSGVEVHDRDMIKVFPVSKALRQVVTLKGNVARPGEYQFKPGMRVTDILPGYQALLPDVWLDSAEITRLASPDNHREVMTINLGKALAGDRHENIDLKEQDTIQVFSRGEKEEHRTIAISGQVVNPGTFDYFPNMTVRDLVTLAGSPKWNAFLDSAELTRIVVTEGKAKSDRISLDLAKAMAGDPKNNLVLQPHDVLIVRGIEEWLEAKERFVTLKGEVRFPGVYSIAKGERLSSVIERAGGFTDRAYLKGAKFTRLSIQENQQKRMDEVIAKSEQDILKRQAELTSLSASRDELEATKASLEGLLKSVEKLKGVKAEGRVVIVLTSLNAFKSTPYDIELMGGDTLDIPLTPNVVNVLGQVYNPTSLIHMPGEKLSYYLVKAGGPTRDGEEGEMYMIKVDGTVQSREHSSFGFHWDDIGKTWTFGGFMATSPDPGDTLVVPQKLERIAWMREIKDMTTIISQIALTAGVVLVGLK